MGKEINLRELFGVFKKRYWILLITIFIGLIAGYGVSKLHKPQPLYQSVTKLVVKANTQSTGMSTLLVMIKDPTVIEKVSQSLNGTRSINQILQEVNVENINNSQILSITVTDPSPAVAAEMANNTAQLFISEVNNILHDNQIQVLSTAQIDKTPLPMAHQHLMTYGVLAGFIIGIGLIFFVHSLDDSIQSDREFEKLLSVPLLGIVPKMNKKYHFKRTKTKHMRYYAEVWLSFLKIFQLSGKSK